MLNNTFIHLQGVGLKTEARLWQAGVLSWDDFRPPYPLNYSPARGDLVCKCLREAGANLAVSPQYFTKLLPASQHWRIFPHFREKTAFLDIESTGLTDACVITTIALYDGRKIKYYVNGENLADFAVDIFAYDVLVSYNGKSFDVPFIENFFDITLPQAHIDLRYVLHGLGITGGLKGCEKKLGLDRGDLAGVDGYFAVLLWQEYQRSGDRKALDTLLAYNIEDTVNLEILMVEAYNRQLANTPFAEQLRLARPDVPPCPFRPDVELIDRLKQRLTANNGHAGYY